MRWRPLARKALGGLLVLSLVFSGWSLWQFSTTRGGEFLVARGAEQMQAAYDRALARHATPERVAELIGDRLQERPRNWVALEGLMALAEAQDMPLPDDLRAEYDTAHAQDFSAGARMAGCAACAYDLRRCSMGADLACGIGVNLTVLGDVVSLGRESGAYMRGEAVDQVDVTLSFIGIGATGLVVLSGGTSLSVKAGAGLMKVAHRMGRMTPGVRRLYLRAFRDGVDWARVPALRSGDDLARVARSDALTPAVEMTRHLGALDAAVGTRGAMHMMRHVDTVADARRISRASTVLGPRSVGAMEVLGKARFLRVGLRLAEPLRDAIAALLAALSAGAGLVSGRVLRALRRAAAGR